MMDDHGSQSQEQSLSRIIQLEKLLHETIQMAEESEMNRQSLEKMLTDSNHQLAESKLQIFQLRQKSLEWALSEKDAQIALYELNCKNAPQPARGSSSDSQEDREQKLQKLKYEREQLIREIQQVANSLSTTE